MISSIAMTLPDKLCQDCEFFLRSRKVTKIHEIPLIELVDKFGGIVSQLINANPAFAEIIGNAPHSIVSIDLPKPLEDISLSMIRATAMFHLVNTALFTPQLDFGNSLPFTVYKSSATNIEKMKDAGIRFYSPDEKLGYHNDVFYSNGLYHLPRLVSLINLFIGYHDPGCFHFVDKRTWEAFPDFLERGIDKTFLFRPTPVVYESKLENMKGLDDFKPVYGLWKDHNNTGYAFCNGELIGSDAATSVLLDDIKNSLTNSSSIISIPQKTDRIFIFRNDIGFHSRDIFQEQYIHQGVTRLFLRAVSGDAVEVPRYLSVGI
jgi:hypothetical protein